jgi:uncharacterized protein (TIGR02145 family)
MKKSSILIIIAVLTANFVCFAQQKNLNVKFPDSLVISNTGDRNTWCKLYPSPKVDIVRKVISDLDIYDEPYQVTEKGVIATINGKTDNWYKVIYTDENSWWAFGAEISFLKPDISTNNTDYSGIYYNSTPSPYSPLLSIEINKITGIISVLSLNVFFDGKVFIDPNSDTLNLNSGKKIFDAHISGNTFTSESLGISIGWFVKTNVKNKNQKIIKGLLVKNDYCCKNFTLYQKVNLSTETLGKEKSNISKENMIYSKFGTFTDSRDSKVYKTVKIGTQIWMAENLAYKTNGNIWAYNNDESNVVKYGYLYDWTTAKKACPAGWHLPTDDEWTKLINYLGGPNVAGGKLKADSGWGDNDHSANESGFSAIPARVRSDEEGFSVTLGGQWWSSNEKDDKNAWSRYLSDVGRQINRGFFGEFKKDGLSVRCIKN